MADRAPYSRVYWTVMDDEKFDGIRENVRHFGAWCLLLVVADMSYPAPGFVPSTVPRSSLRALSECGLVDLLSGGRFRLHGLASERDKRSQSARIANAVRWDSERTPKGVLDETRTRRDETSSTPPPPEGRRENGTNPRALGTNPRSNGTNPRAVRAREKRDPTALHEILRKAADAG